MDAATRVVSQVWIRNGRFAGVGNNLSTQGNPRRIDLRNRTVIPGIVDAQTTLIQARNAHDDGLVRYRVALAALQTLTGTL